MAEQRGRGNAPAEGETSEQTETTATATVENKPHDRVNLGVGMPFEFKQMIEAKAAESQKSGSAWVRDFLADHFEYKLPESHRGGGKKKYATEQEREAAKEHATMRRAALIKALSNKYGDDPEIKAEVERLVQEQIAEKAAKAAEEANKPAEPATA